MGRHSHVYRCQPGQNQQSDIKIQQGWHCQGSHSPETQHILKSLQGRHSGEFVSPLCSTIFSSQQHSISSELCRHHQIYTLMNYVRTLNSKLESQSQSQQFGERFTKQDILWKRCVTIYCNARRSLSYIGSSHALPWNATLRLVLSVLLALETIDPISLYLLMRVQLTVGQHTMDMLREYHGP